MKQYEMPTDTSQKEKSIGGILTFEQGACLGGGAVAGFAILLIIGKITGLIVLGFIFMIPFLIIGAILAFKRKMDMPIYKYWLLKRKFESKPHKLVHMNEQKPVYEGGIY